MSDPISTTAADTTTMTPTTNDPNGFHDNNDVFYEVQEPQTQLMRPSNQEGDELSPQHQEEEEPPESLSKEGTSEYESISENNSLIAEEESLTDDVVSSSSSSHTSANEEKTEDDKDDCCGRNNPQQHDENDSLDDDDNSSYEHVEESFLDLTPQREYWKWDPVWEHIKYALGQKKFCDPVALSQNEAFVVHHQQTQTAPRARAVTVESVESHSRPAASATTTTTDNTTDWWKVAVNQVQQLLHEYQHRNEPRKTDMEEGDLLLELNEIDEDNVEEEEGIFVEEYIEKATLSTTWHLVEHVLVAALILMAGLYLGKKLGLEFEVTPSHEAAPARFLYP